MKHGDDLRCMCGDPQCPSCGTAQGTYDPDVVLSVQVPRPAGSSCSMFCQQMGTLDAICGMCGQPEGVHHPVTLTYRGPLSGLDDATTLQWAGSLETLNALRVQGGLEPFASIGDMPPADGDPFDADPRPDPLAADPLDDPALLDAVGLEAFNAARALAGLPEHVRIVSAVRKVEVVRKADPVPLAEVPLSSDRGLGDYVRRWGVMGDAAHSESAGPLPATWPGEAPLVTDVRERIVQLARSFPCLQGPDVPGLEPWDAGVFSSWARSHFLGGSARSGVGHAAGCVLAVWWGCSQLVAPFDAVAAMRSWDVAHRDAFAAWAASPWWA